MALIPELYLADKSALEQRRHHPDAAALLELLLAEARLATCEMIALEVLYSARNLRDYQRLRDGLAVIPWLTVDGGVMRRALDIQHKLAKKGQHRLPIPDIVIAAAADLHGATLLHYDSDFDCIAEVTGQKARWIVPRGDGG
jgi:predicted nucleic acid-binding protein